MAIRKSDLRDFITEKAHKRKNELRESVRIVVEAAIHPVIFEKFQQAEPVERLAGKFHDLLIEFKETDKRFQNWWELDRIISDISSRLIGLRMDIVRKETHSVLYNLLSRGTNNLMQEVHALVPQLRKKLEKPISEYESLTKLSEEITTIIDALHNGDKAYKRLEELGVDLTGFQAANPNLPAAVKLSVDVCVLNGNC